jgi:excisionase family DNA binding protein
MQLTLGQAAEQVGVSKPTLSKAISTGKLSATRREDGSFAIDPAELHRYVEANGHRFHSATGNGSRLETPPDRAATTAASDAQVEALRQVEVLLRQELTDVRIDRDRWCAEASAWRDQAQAVTRQLTDQREPERRPWWKRLAGADMAERH